MNLFAAEMSHFHDQKVTDFKSMMQHFLQEQISYHHRVRFTFCDFSFGLTLKNSSLTIITLSRLEEAKWPDKLFSEYMYIIKQLTPNDWSRQLSPMLWTSSGLFKQDERAWTLPNALSLLWWLYWFACYGLHISQS